LRLAPDFWRPIEGAVAAAARERRPCLLCIAGNSGCGKSVLGKALRKQGGAGVRPREILVIDDGVASVPFLGFLRRRVAYRSREKDHLRPFSPYFAGKKLIVYINSQPARRVDACDALIEVICADALRLEHLRRRNPDAEKRMADTTGYRLVKPRAASEHRIENDGTGFVWHTEAAS